MLNKFELKLILQNFAKIKYDCENLLMNLGLDKLKSITNIELPVGDETLKEKVFKPKGFEVIKLQTEEKDLTDMKKILEIMGKEIPKNEKIIQKKLI